MISFPFLYCFFRYPLLPELHAGNIIRRVHNKKQYKSDYIDSDQDRQGIQNAANNIINHSAVDFSLRR